MEGMKGVSACRSDSKRLVMSVLEGQWVSVEFG